MTDVMPRNQNSDLVRRGYAAFEAGDMDTLKQTNDVSCTWHSPGKSSLAGDYKGHEQIFGYFGRMGSETHGTFKSHLVHVTESEDGSVVAVHRDTGERNGKRLDVLTCIVYEIKNGKVIDGREFIHDLYAWDTFWG